MDHHHPTKPLNWQRLSGLIDMTRNANIYSGHFSGIAYGVSAMNGGCADYPETYNIFLLSGFRTLPPFCKIHPGDPAQKPYTWTKLRFTPLMVLQLPGSDANASWLYPLTEAISLYLVPEIEHLPFTGTAFILDRLYKEPAQPLF